MVEKNTKINLFGKLLVAVGIALFAVLFMFAFKADAAEISYDFTSTDGSDGYNIRDNNNYTTEPFDGGTTLTLTSSEQIGYVYIKWDKAPGTWTLQAGSDSISCGANGFIQEVVTLKTPSTSATIVIPDGGATIVDIYAYGTGDLPSDVHTWQAPYEKADILLFSTHADDDTLFFGGLIPNYTNRSDVAVQLVYFTEHWSTGEDYRMQEVLDGLWTMGVDHYPQFGEFLDQYSESYEEAAGQYDYEQAKKYCVDAIRKFKPQVVIGQDVLYGEYGHGAHIFFAKALAEAVDYLSFDSSQYTDSATQYGTWQVKKLYFHLYPENVVELDARQALDKFGGKTALEVAKEAYLCHDSQQWCWFYVDDGYDESGNPNGYEYSCTKYGLYTTNVGADTQFNDVLENITPYSILDAPAETTTSETTAADGDEPVATTETTETGETEKSGGNTALIIIIIVVIVAIVVVLIVVISKNKRKKEMEMRRRQAARRRAQQDGRYRIPEDQKREIPDRQRTNNDRPRGDRYPDKSKNDRSDRYR